MFQIKICGVTTPDNALAATRAGADMIGLNFYSASSRYVAPDEARTIAAVVPKTTGVFVNATADEINRIAEQVGLDWVQLHGDEPPELLADIRADLPIIRVRCLEGRGLAAVAEDLESCRENGRSPTAVLIDATVAGEYGGTGKVADWSALRDYQKCLGEMPLILAGGLHAGNVTEAILAVRPFAVDTASGVESLPGVKDAGKLRSFIQAAQIAFDEISG